MIDSPTGLLEAERNLIIASAKAIQIISPIISELNERVDFSSFVREKLDSEFPEAVGNVNRGLSSVLWFLDQKSTYAPVIKDILPAGRISRTDAEKVSVCKNKSENFQNTEYNARLSNLRILTMRAIFAAIASAGAAFFLAVAFILRAQNSDQLTVGLFFMALVFGGLSIFSLGAVRGDAAHMAGLDRRK